MTQTEYKDISAAPGETKFNFSSYLQTPSTQQNVQYLKAKKWILHMSPLKSWSQLLMISSSSTLDRHEDQDQVFPHIVFSFYRLLHSHCYMTKQTPHGQPPPPQNTNPNGNNEHWLFILSQFY
ncbi:hypothetical protein XENOCAPTIV_014854 [Xenoophorus captivus]|uniref:Uncharacterized protein n=1 Tax=Xenoophorus captivus TaxID=1517983 RepID=A0ABV0SAH5_9TELE